MPKKKKTEESFEEALHKLEKTVESLEKGDMPLEKAVEAFTEGIRLVQHCHQKLEEAENKVQILLKNQEGDWKVAPFEIPSAFESSE